MLFSLLDCLLTPQNLPPDCPKDWWELYFVWATIWAIGGSLFQDQMIDYRLEFSKWFIHEFKSVKFLRMAMFSIFLLILKRNDLNHGQNSWKRSVLILIYLFKSLSEDLMEID